LKVLPEYVGGYGALMNDIRENMRYPKSARRLGIEGVVYISMVIDPEGNIVEPRVLRGISQDCDDVALEAVRKLKKFNPGRVKDRTVYVRFVLPIKFKLS
jgi:protein TonB